MAKFLSHLFSAYKYDLNQLLKMLLGMGVTI